MAATIAICLATRNGARFLAEQLNSIAMQSYGNWHLYVRDDCSSDETQNILDDFARDHPDRVTLISDDLGPLGASGNFDRLMGLVREPYVAFSDQDDIWYPDRLSRTLAEMRHAEAQNGSSVPVMVHADRRVIDANRREIAPSYWSSRDIRPRDMRPESHLAFCVAAGSTMLINRPLLDRVHPVPKTARMYDTWIELVAQNFGVVVPLDVPLLEFRRHGGNASGSAIDGDSPAARRMPVRVLRFLQHLERQQRIWDGYFEQAAAFQSRYGDVLSARSARRLKIFLSLRQQHLPGRLAALLRSRSAPPGVSRTLAFVWFCVGPIPLSTARGVAGDLTPRVASSEKLSGHAPV